MPTQSAIAVTPTDANGMIPTKLNAASADTRPRNGPGARSCTVVLANP